MAAALKKSPKPQLSSFFKLMPKPPSPPSSLSDPIARAKSAIRSEPDSDRLAALFQSSASNPKFHGDRTIYKISIQKLARSNRPDLIERILESQKSDPILPRSEGYLICILTLYSDAGMVDHAPSTWAQGRPQAQHTGRRYMVKANHFLIEITKSGFLHHYNVAITPDVISKELCKNIIHQLFSSYKNSLLGKLSAYDGRFSLFTAGALVGRTDW